MTASARRRFIVVSLALALVPGRAAAQTNGARAGYIGTFTSSGKNKAGSRVTFANLDTAKPFITWPSGYGVQTTKVFEDEDSVVLLFVASVTGGTETFYLSKRSMQFTVVEATLTGSGAREVFVQPIVSHGVLK